MYYNSYIFSIFGIMGLQVNYMNSSVKNTCDIKKQETYLANNLAIVGPGTYPSHVLPGSFYCGE